MEWKFVLEFPRDLSAAVWHEAFSSHYLRKDKSHFYELLSLWLYCFIFLFILLYPCPWNFKTFEVCYDEQLGLIMTYLISGVSIACPTGSPSVIG